MDERHLADKVLELNNLEKEKKDFNSKINEEIKDLKAEVSRLAAEELD